MAQPGVLPGLASVLSGVEGGFSVLSSDCHTRVFPVVYICGTLSPVRHAISFLQIVQNSRQIIIGRVLGVVYYNIVSILTIPYRGRWEVWKRLKTPLHNIKMVPSMVII